MKSLFITVLALATYFAVCHGETRKVNAECPGHPGKCYLSDVEELVLDIGQSLAKYPHNVCQKATCEEGFIVRLESCPSPDKGCTVVGGDISKDYPDCCGKIECNEA